MGGPTPSITAGYMNTPRGALFVTTATPANTQCGTVLLLPPLFEERKASAGAFSLLTRKLTAAGLATLRFDYLGTGDSSGTLTDASMEIWLEDARAVAETIKARGMPVYLLGVRFGGALALALHKASRVSGIVLWEPVVDGGDMLRQAVRRKLVNDMAAFGASAATRASLDTAWERGETVDLDGYLVSAALRRGLLEFAPPAVDPETPALLAVTRAGGEADSRRARLCPGADLRIHPSPPFWSTVGLVDTRPAVDSVTEWITNSLPGKSGEPPREALSAIATMSGESAISLRSPRGTPLPAVRHSPTEGEPGMQALCIPGWSGCRLGPHNVFVEFARQAARRGAETLRPDLGGRGESLEPQERATIKSMVDDSVAAVQAMKERKPNTPVAIVAICSGCKVAIMTAAERPEVELLVLWSPEPMGGLRPKDTNRRKTLAMLRIYFLKLCRLETWRKMLTGRVRGAMVGKALLGHETRDHREATDEDAALRKFAGYKGRIVCVFGGGDPESAGSESAYRSFFKRCGIPHIMHTIPRAGHSFYGSAWREELLEHSLAAFAESEG